MIQNIENESFSSCISIKTAEHPCYSIKAHNNSRMHLPVAPACNISCNYCNRKYDCVNESRPGITSEVLDPQEALKKFLLVKGQVPNLKVIGIAGPGDALANFENTKKTIELIHQIDKEIIFCLSTNGLMLPKYANELLELGVFHITITINTIDPLIGAKIYKEVTYLGEKLTGEKAAKTLIENQFEGLKILVNGGAVVKVNIVMIKGINDEHIESVVKKVKESGAYISNIMPLIPAKGSVFEDMPLVKNIELVELRKKCEIDLLQMHHCRQCRADAIGTLSEDISSNFRMNKCNNHQENLNICDPKTQEDKLYTFAVASKSEMMVDEHFGRVQKFLIYQYSNSQIKFVESRIIDKYCDGPECDDEEQKIQKLISSIMDCDGIIVQRIGYGPAKTLENQGLLVIQTCSSIPEAIQYALLQINNKMPVPF